MNTRYIEKEEVLRLTRHIAIAEPAQVRDVQVKMADDHEAANFQTIRFGVAEPDGVPGGVLIAPAAWSDYSSRPFQSLRLGAMARASGLRVIGVDFPGMGNPDLPEKDNCLTDKQIGEAKNGRLIDLSERYWGALLQGGLLTAGDGDDILPVALWGNSLSTLTVTELAASAPENVAITDLYLSEIMGLQKIAVARLAGRMLFKGGKDLGTVYQARNHGLPEYTDLGLSGLTNQVKTQLKGHKYPVDALSKGMHQQATLDALVRGGIDLDLEHGTTVHVVNAEKGLSPKKELIEYSDDLFIRFGRSRSNKKLRRQVLRGEYHGYQDYIAAVLHQLGEITIANVQ